MAPGAAGKTRSYKPDSQQIELIGRAALETQLIRYGFEIARPHRDKGIDLIVFLDAPAHRLAALPIQVKSYTGESFGVMRKYEGRKDLIHAYVWKVLDQPKFFLMTFAEAVRVLPKAQRQTESWNRTDGKAGWHWTRVPESIRPTLFRYEDRWTWLRQRLQGKR